ncbi:MAG: hypothetical protein GX491_18970 [Chloroflexi bacterium]|nr:hypothetical protein [Chloroflexota bacterium]
MENSAGNQEPKQNNRKNDQLFEEIQRDAGIQAIERVAEDHLNQILAVRERYSVDDMDLLTTNVTAIKDIPQNVRDRMSSLHDRMRVIIEQVAANIEARKYRTVEGEVADMQLSVNERTRVTALIGAEKRLQTSYGSLKTTVNVLTHMNDMILRRIAASERSGDRTTERNLVLANAILVYELTNYVIQYVEHFQLEGVEEILQIQHSELKKLSELRKHQNELRKRARASSTPEFRDTTLASIDALEDSVNVIRQEWESYTDEVKEMQSRVGPIAKRLHDLKVLRDLAGMQIRVFEAAAAVGILKRNILALEDAMRGLEKLQLASLTPDRVRRLFYLGSEDTPGYLTPGRE